MGKGSYVMERKCVKCGFEGLHTIRYKVPMVEIVSEFYNGLKRKFEYETKIIQKERLEITCGECDFVTYEPCKDTPKETRIN